jgi:hypothetical protein
MKKITRDQLSKFYASETVTNDDTHVAIGNDWCVWGSGKSEHKAQEFALLELRPIVEEQRQELVSDDVVMRGVAIYEIL